MGQKGREEQKCSRCPFMANGQCFPTTNGNFLSCSPPGRAGGRTIHISCDFCKRPLSSFFPKNQCREPAAERHERFAGVFEPGPKIILDCKKGRTMFVEPTCKHCGHMPCSVDASYCPCCGIYDPNPGICTRFKAVSGALVGSLVFLPCSLLIIAPAYNAHPLAGLIVTAICLGWATWLNIKALWYAIDPTMSLFPRKRPGVSPFQS